MQTTNLFPALKLKEISPHFPATNKPDPLRKLTQKISQLKANKRLGKPPKIFVKRPKLLLIDSDAKDQCLTRAKIASLNLDVISAKDRFTGLEIAANSQVDLILTDVLPPCGFNIIERLREIPQCSEIPIVATSIVNSKSLRAECLGRGCDLFLTKPIARDTLLFYLQFFLDLNSL